MTTHFNYNSDGSLRVGKTNALHSGTCGLGWLRNLMNSLDPILFSQTGIKICYEAETAYCDDCPFNPIGEQYERLD